MLEFRNVSKDFYSRSGTVRALSGVSIDIQERDFCSLVGPSGCGKSTLLHLAAGLEKPTAGDISLGGTPVKGPQTQIGIVFQRPVLLPWRSVLDNVIIQQEVRGLDRTESLAHANRLLESVGLGRFARHLPHELSGGMQQRAAICRALLHRPPVLMMDEPFGALDALTRDQMKLDLLKLWQQEKQTVLFITHDIAEAVLLSTKVVVMTPRPGQVAETIDIRLPYPRTLAIQDTPPFIDYVRRIRGTFEKAGVLHS
jgi:NitT/TauT family transport system ATP-binding protein